MKGAYYFIEWIHVNLHSDKDAEVQQSIVYGTSEEDAKQRWIAEGHPLMKKGRRNNQTSWYQIEGITKMPEEQRIALGYDL